jgi:hypothetical protein
MSGVGFDCTFTFVHSALLGVVFCLDFRPFFIFSLVHLPGVFPLFFKFFLM